MDWKTRGFWVAAGTGIGLLISALLPESQADQVANWGDAAQSVLILIAGGLVGLVAGIRKGKASE